MDIKEKTKKKNYYSNTKNKRLKRFIITRKSFQHLNLPHYYCLKASLMVFKIEKKKNYKRKSYRKKIQLRVSLNNKIYLLLLLLSLLLFLFHFSFFVFPFFLRLFYSHCYRCIIWQLFMETSIFKQ